MIRLILFLFVLCSLFSDICKAQWQPDVRLTNDTARSYTSYNNGWCVTANANILHVVWHDNRDGNYEIYYKRSTDAGISWETDTRLTNDAAFSWYPNVAVSGSVVHVAWEDTRDGSEIYYKHSTDAGLNWGTDTRLTYNSASSYAQCIAVSGSVVHVLWADFRNSNGEIYYIRSTDGGINLVSEIRLTNAPSDSHFPSVTVSGSVVHVAWQDERDGNSEIYYKRSTDGGVSWGADIRLTNNSSYSEGPSISMYGQAVHVVWYDFRDGGYEIYYKRLTDAGLSWGTDTRLTINSAGSLFPSISVSGSNVHVVFENFRNGNWEIYYKRSTDGGVSWGADTRLTNNSGYSASSSVAVSGSAVHAVWKDNRDGNWEIYYKRDPTGNPIGIINTNSEIPVEFSLSQNYPNPFNPTTNIRFALPKISFVKLVVYDALGREVETLVNEQLNAGTYETDWNASNYPSGVYYCKLSVGDASTSLSATESKKIVLVK